jgi:aspartyl-tRNA(Asn)/glutamyl-tRNA(Gln) amidotransferase subunit C
MLTEADLAKIAQLSKLNVDPGESTDLISKLSQILDAVSALSEVNTAGVEPLFHVSSQMNMRVDRGEPALDRNELLKNAPGHNHESFSLPRAFGAFEEF